MDLFWWLRRNKYCLEKVFTPTTYAELSYADRNNIQEDFVRNLKLPGKQIIVYGHSGSGKSTLVNKMLKDKKRNYIISSCIQNTHISDIILDAFDQLNVYYTSSVKHGKTSQISAELKLEYSKLSDSIKGTTTTTDDITQSRVLPPQLTPQRLCEFLGKANCIWVIEDFHKVIESEKVQLAQILKMFVDASNLYPNTKIIVIGASETAREMVRYDAELAGRVSELSIPLLANPELKQIIHHGTELLNIQFSSELVDEIVRHSNHLGTLTHQLCYNICSANNIEKRTWKKIQLEHREIDNSIRLFMQDKTDTFKQQFDKITQQRTGQYENVKTILNAMLLLNKEELTHHEILVEIQRQYPEYPPGNLSSYIKRLTNSDLDEVIRFDANSGKYSFSDPFFKAYVGMTLRGETNDEPANH